MIGRDGNANEGKKWWKEEDEEKKSRQLAYKVKSLLGI